MRRTSLFALAAVCALCLGLLSACNSGAGSAAGQSSAAQDQAATSASSAATVDGGKVKVVCATFTACDWVREVIGDQADRFDLTLLLDDGVDLHSYQPTVADIAKIADCDLFVHVGGESDDWVADALADADNEGMRVVNMLEAVGSAAVEEETVEGMQAEEEDGAEEAEDGPEYDEHVWLSLRNAQAIVGAIADALGEVDPGNAREYGANAEAYNSQLAELDAQYAKTVSVAARDTLVFADRFPFRYLVDDYGLKYHAAFAGCSAETEASFETVAFLADKVDELGVKNVLVIEGSDRKIADTVIANTHSKDQQILVMDSLQSVSADDIAAGKTYIGTMQGNLSVLEQALS